MKQKPLRIVVVGGGAAGFFAAIRCAELNPRAEVRILERGREVLGKVKISGGGRCNLTHACFEPRELIKNYPRGARELLGPFHQFACGDTLEWFEKRGVATKIEADGRIFPVSDRSQTIMDCLLDAAHKAGVQILYHHRVDDFTFTPDGWEVSSSQGVFIADRLFIATGSNPRIWERLRSLGHTIVEAVPSLFTFNIKDPRLVDIPGISVPSAEVSIPDFKRVDSGPLLITHWGLSGPTILRLSAWGARELASCNYQFRLLVNWTGAHPETIKEQLRTFRVTDGKKQIQARAQFGLPLRLWQKLVRAAVADPQQRWADLSNKELQDLALQLSECTFQVTGKSTFKEEFVTAGGVQLAEVNFKRFESKKYPNLFFAGEVLDIDAITGGFNFQAAWTGGWIAGAALATSHHS